MPCKAEEFSQPGMGCVFRRSWVQGIFSRCSNRRRHVMHVTAVAGGSAHRELLPGSVPHSAARLPGVTAW
jgi:hypothetical protein